MDYIGGGAELSIASLPITYGFEKFRILFPSAGYIADSLKKGWENYWYQNIFDLRLPWLTQARYFLALSMLLEKPEEESKPKSKCENRFFDNGSGILNMGEWQVRLGVGGTIGWMHHRPTGSCRVFGSPVGLSMREGPWELNGDRVYHPSLGGYFPDSQLGELSYVEGDIAPVSVNDLSRAESIKQYAWFGKRKEKFADRLIPVHKKAKIRSGDSIHYRREFEIKDGAFTVETFIEGKIKHRIPLIWFKPGSGKLLIDDTEHTGRLSILEKRVSKITFSDDYWDDWDNSFR